MLASKSPVTGGSVYCLPRTVTGGSPARTAIGGVANRQRNHEGVTEMTTTGNAVSDSLVPDRLEEVDPSYESRPHPDRTHYCSETGGPVDPILVPGLGEDGTEACYCPVTGNLLAVSRR